MRHRSNKSPANRWVVIGVGAAAVFLAGATGATLLSDRLPRPAGQPTTVQTPAPTASAANCTGALTGRTLTPTQWTFGGVQGQPPLPLKAGEYILSIDDGPNPATTPALIDLLHRHCVHAIFFLIGWRAQHDADLVKQIEGAGFNVGSHSYTHHDFGKMTAYEAQSDILRGAAAVAASSSVVGGELHYFRIPGSNGLSPLASPETVAFLRANKLLLAGYDISPEDWRNDPPDVSFTRLFRKFPDRGVIVMHDGQSNTLPLMPMVLDELQRRGAKIVTLGTPNLK